MNNLFEYLWKKYDIEKAPLFEIILVNYEELKEDAIAAGLELYSNISKLEIYKKIYFSHPNKDEIYNRLEKIFSFKESNRNGIIKYKDEASKFVLENFKIFIYKDQSREIKNQLSENFSILRKLKYMNGETLEIEVAEELFNYDWMINGGRTKLDKQLENEIWESHFNCISFDGNEKDLNLIEWHHCLSDSKKMIANEREKILINHINNLIPLSIRSHRLIHRPNSKLSNESIIEKEELLLKIYNEIVIKYLDENISFERYMELHH